MEVVGLIGGAREEPLFMPSWLLGNYGSNHFFRNIGFIIYAIGIRGEKWK